MQYRPTIPPPPLPESYRRVFLPAEDEGVFRDVTWRSVLVPYGLNVEDQIGDVLFSTVTMVGDDMIMVTDFDTIPPHQEAR